MLRYLPPLTIFTSQLLTLLTCGSLTLRAHPIVRLGGVGHLARHGIDLLPVHDYLHMPEVLLVGCDVEHCLITVLDEELAKPLHGRARAGYGAGNAGSGGEGRTVRAQGRGQG